MKRFRQRLLALALVGLPGCAAAAESRTADQSASSRPVAPPAGSVRPSPSHAAETLTPDEEWAELANIRRAPELDAAYLTCARRRGFDPGFAEVLGDPSGRPEYVKTSAEVPAHVHGPCFEELGGVDSGRTSQGNP